MTADRTCGLVAATRQEAIRQGERALMAGGNALDAAIAASFVLAVVEPYMTGPGAVGELVYVRPDGGCTVVEAAAHAPRAARPDMFDVAPAAPVASAVDYEWQPVRDRSNELGFLAATAPRLVQGLAAVHQELGNLPWADLVLPAADQAESGHELDFFTAAMIAAEMRTLSADPLARQLYFPDGFPLQPPLIAATRVGPNPELAASLRLIAEYGGAALADGPLADAIIASSQSGGGMLTRDDLRVPARVLSVAEPLASFRGWSIFGSPFPSGATTAAHILRLAEERPPVPAGALSATRFVNSARAVVAAVRMRQDRLAGSDSPAHVRELLRAKPDFEVPIADSGYSRTSERTATTTHLSVADSDGGVVALTLTLLKTFGCQRTPSGCGFFLNNGMWWFDPIPGRRQSVAGGARALSAVSPLVAVSPDGKRRIGLGGLGARPIFASVAQTLESIIDYDLDVAAAVDLPRVHSDGTRVFVDHRVPETVASRLEAEVGPVERVPYNPISLTNARLTGVDTAPADDLSRVGIDARARATYEFGVGLPRVIET